MKIFKLTIVLLSVLFLSSCASSYKSVNPAGLNYKSRSTDQDVSLEYKYDLLRKKYAKKEQKKDIRVVAVKITNNSDHDLVFGSDIRLTYENGSQLQILNYDKTFKSLKQKPATYLLYLLLTPLTLTTETPNATNSYPAGLIIGPGLAGGNLIAASSANKRFKEELMAFDLSGRRISKGETVYGLIGVRADNYDALKINIHESRIKTDKDHIAR